MILISWFIILSPVQVIKELKATAGAQMQYQLKCHRNSCMSLSQKWYTTYNLSIIDIKG